MSEGRGAAIGQRQVKPSEVQIELNQLGIEHAKCLLQKLLTGLVAFQYHDRDGLGHGRHLSGADQGRESDPLNQTVRERTPPAV